MALNSLWVQWLEKSLGSGATSGSDSDPIATETDNVQSLSLNYGFNGTGWSRVAVTPGTFDGKGAEAVGNLRTVSQPHLFNGDTFDRERGTTEETILASAARTATTNSADFTNYNAKGIKVVIDVTVDPAAASVVFDIEGKDSVSGKYYSLLTSAAIVAVGTTVLTVFPGVSETANVKASDMLPRTYRVTATHADADSITYSVSGALAV